MEPWFKYNYTSPLQTFIPNKLGMSLTIQNDTEDSLVIRFNTIRDLFEAREIKYYVRDIEDEIVFVLPNNPKVYNVSRYVNNIVIKKTNDSYQPAFFFSTRKFVD